MVHHRGTKARRNADLVWNGYGERMHGNVRGRDLLFLYPHFYSVSEASMSENLRASVVNNNSLDPHLRERPQPFAFREPPFEPADR